MLRWRLVLGALLIAALVAVCWLDLRTVRLLYAPVPGLWLMPLALLASFLATQEVLNLAGAANLRPLRWPVYLGNIVIVAGNWFVVLVSFFPWNPSSVSASSWSFDHLGQMVSPTWTLAAAVILVFFAEMRRYEKPGNHIANIAVAVFALVYVGLMMSFAVSLRITWGVGALATWVIAVKMGDTGAYTVGRLIGRHKLCPLLSPGKTIEGAVGALAFSCLGSWLAFHYLVPITSEAHSSLDRGPWWGWIAFGILVGTAGILGDLAESLMKRDVGRKDSSNWMPGFGGVLDILDSLLLAAPVAWFCWAYDLIGPIPIPN